MYIFYKKFLQWIYWNLFLSHVVSKIFASAPLGFFSLANPMDEDMPRHSVLNEGRFKFRFYPPSTKWRVYCGTLAWGGKDHLS